jgi:glycosyltransferase involved in cell wall biosynthesis
LRLLTITHYFPAHGGGIELVAQELVRQFATSGLSVEWISSDTDSAPPDDEAVRFVPVATVNIIERMFQLPYPLWWPTSLIALSRAIGRADLVQIHEHLYFGSILGVLIARLRGRPIVITQHMGALRMGGRLSTWAYANSSRWLGWAVFGAAKRVVFISANVRGFFGLEQSSKASLIFNGVDSDQFRWKSWSAARQARVHCQLPANRQTVLFVGRFVRKKGMHIIRELVQRFPHTLWVFAGAGPEDPRRWAQENVRVVGKVDREELSRLYQAADLLFLPSSAEGMPLVVQEALACGLGVLSSQEVADACPDARSIIRGHFAAGTESDVEGWERAVREALDDTDYLSDRESRAKQAQLLWSWSICASKYLRLFDEVLSGRNRIGSG